MRIWLSLKGEGLNGRILMRYKLCMSASAATDFVSTVVAGSGFGGKALSCRDNAAGA